MQKGNKMNQDMSKISSLINKVKNWKFDGMVATYIEGYVDDFEVSIKQGFCSSPPETYYTITVTNETKETSGFFHVTDPELFIEVQNIWNNATITKLGL